MKPIALVILLAACGGGDDLQYMTQVVPPRAVQAPPNGGLIIFVRPSGVASFRHSDIMDENGRFVGRSSGAAHFVHAVPAGRHMFVVWGENTDAIDIDVAPGRIYFVEVAIQPGFWSPSYQLYGITPRSSSWAKRDDWIRSTKQMMPDLAGGQAYLDTRAADVQERLKRGREHLQEYQVKGPPVERDRHFVRAEDGI